MIRWWSQPIYERILTAEIVAKREWNLPNICTCKNAQKEYWEHQTPILRALHVAFIMDKLEGSQQTKEILLLMMFISWRERCARIFRGLNKKTLQIWAMKFTHNEISSIDSKQIMAEEFCFVIFVFYFQKKKCFLFKI